MTRQPGSPGETPTPPEPVQPGGQDGGVTEADIDLGPWVGASPEESGPAAEFRREVAAVAREILVDVARRGVDIGCARRQRSGAEDRRDSGVEAVEPRQWDPWESTPLLLLRAASRLEARLGHGRRGRLERGDAVRRDLALVDAARPGGTSPGRLRRRLGLASASVSGLVRRCEARGLMARELSGSDGRTSRLTATAAGRAAMERASRAWRAADDQMVSGLTVPERDELRRLLRKAGRALG